MKKGKVWGTTETVIATPFCEVHRILVEAGGHSSWHHHARKWNAFTLYSGELRIETEDGKLVTQLDLGQGDVTSIPPGVVHRFVNVSGDEAWGLELYYPEGLSEDIIRATVGGKL